jgi:hypothetical protein
MTLDLTDDEKLALVAICGTRSNMTASRTRHGSTR